MIEVMGSFELMKIFCGYLTSRGADKGSDRKGTNVDLPTKWNLC